jgi:hypothetical protein
MTEGDAANPDPLCWFCPNGRAVQQQPPLCPTCQREARERLRRFLAGSRAKTLALADRHWTAKQP